MITIYRGSLLQVKQAQFHLNGSNVSLNSFKNYNFLTLGPKPSTLIITSNQFSTNNLTFSQLFAGALAPEYTCSYTGSEFVQTLTPLYRYTFILNSTFEHNNLDSSILLSTGNGFMAIHNNIMDDEYIWNSQYINMLSSPSQNGLDSISFSRNSPMEDSTLKSNSVAKQLFEEIMTKALIYQPNNIYFTSIYNNKITNTNLASVHFFTFTSFHADQTFISVEKNLFSVFGSSTDEHHFYHVL